MLMELEREAAKGMGSRMELFELIRRDRDREGLSIRALAERHGVHRRAVRQALVSPVPVAKRSPVGRAAPKLGAYRGLIDEWLEADREAPRKQRHTAKRIWSRLVDEHGAEVAETTVRDYVRSRKRAMGWPVGEVFVPQAHAPGVGAEVDWGEAQIDLAGARTGRDAAGPPLDDPSTSRQPRRLQAAASARRCATRAAPCRPSLLTPTDPAPLLEPPYSKHSMLTTDLCRPPRLAGSKRNPRSHAPNNCERRATALRACRSPHRLDRLTRPARLSAPPAHHGPARSPWPGHTSSSLRPQPSHG